MRVPPLSPEAMRVMVSAFLATASPKRLRRMREAVELTFGAQKIGLTPDEPGMGAAHELVLVALERAEQKALRRRRR
jgi:hypothetical protein